MVFPSLCSPCLSHCRPSPFTDLLYALDGVPCLTLRVGTVEAVEAVVGVEVTEVGYVVCVM